MPRKSLILCTALMIALITGTSGCDIFQPSQRFTVTYEVSGGSGHVTEVGGNIMGKIYGASSFLSGRAVEQATGQPIEGARIAIMGPARPAFRETNAGGWFSVARAVQRNGRYFHRGLEKRLFPVGHIHAV